MFNQIDVLVAEYADLERQLADPSVHADAGRARTLGRRYAELGPIVTAYQRVEDRRWRRRRGPRARR